MFFQQYDLACLSLYSYLIGDTTTGRPSSSTPSATSAEYLADAERQRPAPSSGSSRPTSTPTSSPGTSSWPRPPARSSPTATWPSPDFPIEPLADGQRLSLGEVTLEIRHTPGHTPESISIVV